MKIKYSALVSDMRGKLNGSVASRNRGGSYLRNKVTPVNPTSAAQSTVRTRLTTNAQAWKGLTQSQRNSWNASVGDFAKTNIFGDLRNPSGFNLYCSINNNLSNIGVASVNTPPTSSAVASVGLVSASAAVGALTMAIVLSAAVPAGSYMVVAATPGLSAGVSFVKSELRIIQVVAPAATTPVSIVNAWNTKFGSLPAAGKRFFVEVYFINAVSGVMSARQKVSAIVAA